MLVTEELILLTYVLCSYLALFQTKRTLDIPLFWSIFAGFSVMMNEIRNCYTVLAKV